MPETDLSQARSLILEKLRAAGARGLPKSQLPLKSAVRSQAWAELLRTRAVANLGTARRTQFVLIEHFRPLELAGQQIMDMFPDRTLLLMSLTKIRNGLTRGEIARKADQALDILVKDGRLLKVRHGRSLLFMNVAALRIQLPAGAAPQPPSDNRDVEALVRAAYQRVSRRVGFSDVQIWELREESGLALADLREYLREKSRSGQAVLSKGDWSLAAESVRAAAIELDGEPQLLVRFKE